MSALYISLGHISKLMVGFLLLKLLAYYNGVEGLNQVGNLLTVVSVVVAFSGGGIINGIIKYSSEWRGDKDLISKLISTSVCYSLIFNAVVFFIILISYSYIIKYIFNDVVNSLYYVVFLTAIIFFYGLYNVYQGLAYGFGYAKTFPIIQLISSILTLMYFFLFLDEGLISSYNAIVFMLASLSIPFAYYLYKNNSVVSSFVYVKPERYIFKLLYPYTLMALFGALSFPFIEVVLRTLITDLLGANISGLWTAAMKLSLAISAFFSLFLVYILVPKMAVIHTRKAMVNLVFKYLGYIGIPYLIILITAYIFRGFYIKFALSDDFIILSNYLVYQFSGDFFKVLSYVITVITIAKSWPKLYILGEVIQGGGLLIFVCFFLFFITDVESVFIAYQAFYMCYFLAAVLFFCFFALKRFNNHD